MKTLFNKQGLCIFLLAASSTMFGCATAPQAQPVVEPNYDLLVQLEIAEKLYESKDIEEKTLGLVMMIDLLEDPDAKNAILSKYDETELRIETAKKHIDATAKERVREEAIQSNQCSSRLTEQGKRVYSCPSNN